MSDLISRQDAIDALAKFVPYAICDDSTESYTNGLKDAYNLICQLPSTEPKTGEWIYNTNNESASEIWNCSECDQWSFAKTNFCPNCGADMGGEKHE